MLGTVHRLCKAAFGSNATLRRMLVALGIAAAWSSAVMLLSPAGAGMGEVPSAWTVVEATGVVQMHEPGAGSRWQEVSVHSVLSTPAVVRTGPGARAVLKRDDDLITLTPGTELQLPNEPEAAQATRIVQTEGEAFFEVGPRPGWDFSVETPYLVVVVKGTKFAVGVSEDGTSVAVSEGRVQVGRNGSTKDVSAGQAVHGSSAPDGGLSDVSASSAGAVAPAEASAGVAAGPSADKAAENGQAQNGRAGETSGDAAAGNGSAKASSGNGSSNGKSGNNGTGNGDAGSGSSSDGNSGQGNSSQGNSGQGNSGQGNSGQGNSGQGNSGQGNSGQGNSGQGNSGQGNSGQGDSGNDSGNNSGGNGKGKGKGKGGNAQS